MNTPWGFPDFDAHEALHFVTDEKSSRPMSGVRVAAQLRELKRIAPNLLIRMLDNPGGTTGEGSWSEIVGPGKPSGDFVIDGPESHGVLGLVNLIGIESPGLTSSLAIGEKVAGMTGV